MLSRHNAYNIVTGEVISTTTANALKRAVRWATQADMAYGYPVRDEWRFCHDYGKKWEREGIPSR